jgi:hypothetical protein
MRTIFSIIIVTTTLSLSAQRNRVPKMAPIFSEGYYVNYKGDTLQGEIQTNLEDETEFYKTFAFRGKGTSKPRVFNGQRVRAYGFNDKHFVSAAVEGEKRFLERLTDGRLRFFEYRFHGKIDGFPGIESAYFIKDTRAEGEDLELQELKKISIKFYKKSLKPYMKDQPMIWSDLDKYTFDKQNLVKSINEFNRYYVTVAN